MNSNGNESTNGHRRNATISPHNNDVGAQPPSNEHIDRLGGILLTYNFYEKELGTSRFAGTLHSLLLCMLTLKVTKVMCRACQTCVHLCTL